MLQIVSIGGETARPVCADFPEKTCRGAGKNPACCCGKIQPSSENALELSDGTGGKDVGVCEPEHRERNACQVGGLPCPQEKQLRAG